MITALMIIPLTFALGMAFDLTMSQTRKDQLDGIADAAALGGVTPAMMAASAATAKTQSTALFNGQETSVSGVVSPSVTVTATDTASGSTVTRTVVVSYTAQSQNAFAAVLGLPSLPISGSSTATSKTAPNINFYLLLDTSPSMEIAATTAGMSTLEADTQQEIDGARGCAFGCHQSNPADLSGPSAIYQPCLSHTDPATGQPTSVCQFLTPSYAQIPCTTSGAYADGVTFNTSSTFPETGRDNYDLSRCIGVTLRIDLLRTAVQNLMSTAASTEATNKASYQMALYETDTNQANSNNDLNLYTLQSMTSDLTGAASTSAASISALEVYFHSYLVAGDNNQDLDTFLDADVNSMRSVMPDPGGGTKNPGDTPQEVLFIVTDGLNDETPSRTYAPLDWNGDICTAIKARGIRIAVLYTTYFPQTAAGDWYETNVLPALPSGLPPDLPSSTPVGADPMALGAQQCASPGLYYQVTTNGDISTALNELFQEAVATARLSQ
jgi:hypothetical protein